jgi:hypothetical protein
MKKEQNQDFRGCFGKIILNFTFKRFCVFASDQIDWGGKESGGYRFLKGGKSFEQTNRKITNKSKF